MQIRRIQIQRLLYAPVQSDQEHGLTRCYLEHVQPRAGYPFRDIGDKLQACPEYLWHRQNIKKLIEAGLAFIVRMRTSNCRCGQSPVDTIGITYPDDTRIPVGPYTPRDLKTFG